MEPLVNSRAKVTDNFWDTPSYAVRDLLPYIKPNSRVLCPYDRKESAFNEVFTRAGHQVTLFEWGIPEDLDLNGYDYVITNPPYSKDALEPLLNRLTASGIKYALLLPVNYLGGVEGSGTERNYSF